MPRMNTPSDAAKALLPHTPHHYSKVCDKHPELEGARRKNYGCVWCHRDYTARWEMRNRVRHLKMRAASKRRTRARKKKERADLKIPIASTP